MKATLSGRPGPRTAEITAAGCRRDARSDSRRRSLAVFAVALLGLAGWAGPAPGQCTISSGPTDLHLNTAAPSPLANFTSAVPYLNGTRAIIRADWGFGVYDITNPAFPSPVSWANHFSADPNWGFLGGCGDGQSFSTDWIAASGDGARAFSSTASRYECRASNLVMSPNGSGFFKISGDTGYSRAKFLAVQKWGSRYILYGLAGYYSQVWAADVSDPLPGFIVVPGGVSPSKGNVPFEVSTFPAASSTRAMKYVDPGFLLLADYDKLSIVDVSNPGPAGSITTGKTWKTVFLSDFGRPDYPASQLVTVGAALNSAGNLYIVGEFKNASNQPDGFSLIEWNPTTGSKTLRGSFLPAAGFSGTGSMSGSSVSLVEQQPGIGVFFWAASQTGGTGDKPRYRLYAATGDGWRQGSLPQEVLTVDTGANPTFAGVAQSGFAWRPSNNDVVSIIATVFSAYTLNLSCQLGPAPAISTLKVEMEPCPASGPCEVKTGSSPVVVGQKLKLSPTILPSAAVLPIIDWKLDFDYHSSETPGTSWGSLKNPDYATSPTWTAGTTFSFIGPCDKNVSADPASGTNCWTSVIGNGSYGGPDFGSANPPWGSTSTGLQAAFEGRNSLGTSGPALVPVTWKVPTVQLASYTVLKGNLLQDATERPTNDPLGDKAGYKWYIPNSPNTNPVPGDLVAACNGKSTCPFNPVGPPGVYKVWLTTPPYPGGYQSCDLGAACASGFSPLPVTLTEIVPNFTIGGSPAYPTTVLLSLGSLSVVDTSTKGPAITITGHKYCYTAPGASCDPATGNAFTPGATAIPLPAKGDYWFFFGVTYTGGGNSFEYFTPNKETNPRAWKVCVIDPTVTVSVSPNPASATPGTPINFTATATGGTPGYYYKWDFGDGTYLPYNPTPSVIHYYATAGTYTATCTAIDSNGATGTSTTTVVIDCVSGLAAGNNGPVCPGGTILLSATPISGAIYSWTGPNGFTSTAQNPAIPAATPAESGTYFVTVTVNGCTSSPASTLVVVKLPPPAPTVGNSGPICAGDTLSLTASTISGASYLWAGPNGFSSTQQNPSIPNATALATGLYSVTVTVDGCSTVASTSAVVRATPAAPLITAPTSTLPGATGQVASVPLHGGSSYLWGITNGTITSGAGTNQITFTAGSSGVTILTNVETTSTGCVSATATEYVNINVQRAGLVEDAHSSGGTISNVNNILEPGERILVNPSWKNVSASPLALTGTASAFTGPAGATYTILDSAANYGTIAPGATADSFTAGGPSYRLAVSNTTSRPAAHWDATFLETLSTGGMNAWTLHVGQSFTDVPSSDVSYPFVENIFHNGITVGCAPGQYCPYDSTPRWQMAVFLARAILGPGMAIPVSGTVGTSTYDCSSGGTSLFSDVAPADVGCPGIHYIYSKQVTVGCAPGLFCPNDLTSRWQMAVFLSRAMLGPGVPIPTSGTVPGVGAYSCTSGGTSLFSDIPATDLTCPGVHYIYSQAVTVGCGGGKYCPNDLTPRWQMAVFLVRAFHMSFLH